MKKNQPDFLLFFVIILLIGVGLSMIYSASAKIALKRFGNEKFFLQRQIYGSLIAIIVLIFVSYVNVKMLVKLATPLLVLSLIMCFLVFVPGLGVRLRGVSNVNRWLNLRIFIFQPSELAKLAIIINLAAILYRKKEKVKNFILGFAWPLLIVILFFFLIMLQPDFTTAVFILLVSIVMFYIAGISVKHLAMLGLIGLPIITILVGVAGYRLKRIWAFISTDADSLGASFQINESLKSFARGGFLGVGIGKGQKTLPEPFTDFIFSVYGEEIGFIGSLLVVVLFAVFAYRGIKIALDCKDRFLSLLSFGLTFMIIFQALINIMVTLGLLPTTGITLPFLSFGRSSLIISAIIGGILLNVSRKVNAQEEVTE